MGSADADFGYPAWRGFVTWAFSRPEMQIEFTAQTGMQMPKPPQSGLDAMIDKATGYPDKHAEEFVLWISAQYGAEFCPPAVQDALAARAKAGS